MTTALSKYVSSLILLEWAAIMLYFNLSGRVSAFLHPNFRPLLWIVGIMLVLTALSAFSLQTRIEAPLFIPPGLQ